MIRTSAGHFVSLKFLWIILLSVLYSATGLAKGYLRTAGKKIINEKRENVLLRGFGLKGYSA